MGYTMESGGLTFEQLRASLAANLDGRQTENGAGPYTIGTSPAPVYPQWWVYDGTTASVALTLPLPNVLYPGLTDSWLVVVQNNGTGSASVDVGTYLPTALGTVAIGESWLIGWNPDTLDWEVIGKWGTGGGGGFVNPMANNDPLQGTLSDGTTIVDLVNVDSSDLAILGDPTVITVVEGLFTILRVAGSNRFIADNSSFRPVNDNTRGLGNATARWLGLFNSGVHTEAVRSTAATVVVNSTDATIVALNTAIPDAFVLPNPASEPEGRRIHFYSRPSSTQDYTASVTGGTAIVGGTNPIAPGEFRVFIVIGSGVSARWYQVAAP